MNLKNGTLLFVGVITVTAGWIYLWKTQGNHTQQVDSIFVVDGGIANQNDLDDIAKYLKITVEVVDNLQFFAKYSLSVKFDNKASRSLSGLNWKIYFYSFYVIESEHMLSDDGHSFLPEGYVLENAKLRVKHEQGGLYSLTPLSGFPEIPPSTKREITFFGANWAVSKTDIPPNWYIVVDGLVPRVFESTKGDFVANFTRPNQWKRTSSDKYNPFTPSDRYNRYKTSSSTIEAKPVIPTPKFIKRYNSTWNLDMSGRVYIIQGGGLSSETNYLADLTSYKQAYNTIKGAVNIYLTLSKEVTSEEGYILKSSNVTNNISIKANTRTGIFHGIQTMLSLIHRLDGKDYFPMVLVKDEPRYSFRGMHVDIARNFKSKTSLMKLLDAMAMYKLNKIHLHATDDEGWRLEIKDLPELTEVGSNRCHDPSSNVCLPPQLGSGPDKNTQGSGYLSIQDYKDLIQYANVRHIEVIPEIDIPSHSRAAIMAMESRYRKFMKIGQPAEANKYRLVDPNDLSKYLSVQLFSGNAMSPCIESTYTFVQKIVTEIKAMHDSAGQSLKTFHFGGDEVPKNAWSKKSISCDKLGFTGTSSEIRNSMKKYFLQRISKITQTNGLNLQGWEDGLINGNGIPFSRRLFQNNDVTGNIWDNVWEWGMAKRAYNLANAGYKVVMSHATHLYFDHPYEPDPEERGLYWAPRFIDTLKTFGFMPDHLYQNIDFTRMGAPLNREDVCGANDAECPKLQKPENIIGIQGNMWSETAITDDNLYYMVFPRLLALSERAWHVAEWENITNSDERNTKMRKDWDKFASALGARELKRLDDMGISYRIPPPGARIVNGNEIEVESTFKELDVEYSADGGLSWKTLKGKLNTKKEKVLLRTKSADGKRRSRTVELNLDVS